jgi:hypothetical protein
MTIKQRKTFQRFLRRPERNVQWMGDRIGELVAALLVLFVVFMLLD